MKTAFITGIAGQDGSYLSALLLEKGYAVYGSTNANSDLSNLSKLNVKDKVTLISVDLLDSESLKNTLNILEPDEIYNFASQSHVGKSWEEVQRTTQVNSLAVANILENIRHMKKSVRFLQASSCAVYGNTKSKKQDEQTAFAPQSPYATSKAYSHWLVQNYRKAYNMFAVNAILFSHESKIRSDRFVTRKITKFIAQVKKGKGTKLTLGDINIQRDFGHAQDFTKAMWLMLQQDCPEDFVIGTGQTHSIKDILDIGFNYIGIQDWSEYVEYDKSLIRPAEVSSYCADWSKAKHMLNWQPKMSLTDTIKEMIDEDLQNDYI